MRVVICAACGADNETGATVCNKCGRRRRVASRATATTLTALAILWGCGLGHIYLGHTRRGIAWWLAPLGVLVPLTLLARPIGAVIGYRVWSVLLLVAAIAVWVGALIDVGRVAVRETEPPPDWRMVLFAIGFFIAGRLTALPIRAFVIEAFKIPAGSMIPTLLIGDHVFVRKSADAGRGDVIVFPFPEHPEQDFIKRVIAAPGDALEMRGGHPWINGWEVPHCLVGGYRFGYEGELHDGELFIEYLERHAYLVFYDKTAVAAEAEGPFTAKPGELWVLGDNRNNSHDSRQWFNGAGGGVPVSSVRGRPFMVWLSQSEQGPDWARLGLDVDAPTLPSGASELQPRLEACLHDRPSIEKATPPDRAR